MNRTFISITLVYFIALATTHPSNAQNSPQDYVSMTLMCFTGLATTYPSNQNSPKDYVDSHNAVRAQVGVGPLSWDDNVAGFAQDYVNQRARDCALVHSGGGGKYGENIAVGSGDFTGVAAVYLWADEKASYNYNTNSCAQDAQCGHYTQIVWRNSVRIGCARAQCNSGSWFITCNYDPPGNYIGERPY